MALSTREELSQTLVPGLHRVFSYKLQFHDGVDKRQRYARRTFAHVLEHHVDFVFQVSAGRVSYRWRLLAFSRFSWPRWLHTLIGAARLILQDVCTVLGAFV